MGRQSTYTQEKADSIGEQIANGVPLAEICRQPGMPNWRTVYGWMDANEEFAAAIARARYVGEGALFEQCLVIADTPLIGEEVEETDDGKVKTKRGDMLGHRKLQIDTRLKLLAKWNPKKYGDKLQLGGAEGLPPLHGATDDQLMRRAAEILAKQSANGEGSG